MSMAASAIDAQSRAIDSRPAPDRSACGGTGTTIPVQASVSALSSIAGVVIVPGRYGLIDAARMPFQPYMFPSAASWRSRM